MKTLLDLLIEKLPEGAEIRNAKETTNRFKFIFAYDGYTTRGSVMKMCAPGHEGRYVIKEIASHMATICIMDKKDLAEGKKWLDIGMTGEMPEKEEKKCTD